MIEHARYAVVDKVLAELAHRDWLDIQYQDEVLADEAAARSHRGPGNIRDIANSDAMELINHT